ncbi:hypothetical protein Tco_0901907 [Tanacetum coccineum]
MGYAKEVEAILEIKVYEFDEVVMNDELMTKKLIKFRLGGHGHTLTFLELARRLGLYHSDEINEEGFEVYFQEGLRSDENFNDMDYWLSISSEEELHFKASKWLCEFGLVDGRWLKRKGVGSQRDKLIGPNGKLNAEDPTPGVLRVAMPRGPRPSMQDLYDRMGNIEIRQGVLERMACRQSYHSNRRKKKKWKDVRIHVRRIPPRFEQILLNSS